MKILLEKVRHYVLFVMFSDVCGAGGERTYFCVPPYSLFIIYCVLIMLTVNVELENDSCSSNLSLEPSLMTVC